jgi:hypothetical protein
MGADRADVSKNGAWGEYLVQNAPRQSLECNHHGGVSAVSRITGMARSTIARGVEEIIKEKEPVETGGYASLGADARPNARRIPPYCLIWNAEWNRQPVVTRCGCCDGHPKVWATCQRRCTVRVIRFALT